MSTPVTLFTFNTASIRVVTIAGNPWFVAKDVLEALGYRLKTASGNPISTTNYLPFIDKSELLTMRKHPTSDEPFVTGLVTGTGVSKVILISESGLYKLVMRSDKPEAKAFQDWVTKIVLPAIRKDGGYIAGEEKLASGELSEDEFILRAVTILQGKVARITAERDEARKELSQHVEAASFLTVDEFRARLRAYWSFSMRIKVGQMARMFSIQNNLRMDSEKRTIVDSRGLDRVVSVNVYTREALEYAADALAA